VPHGPDLDEDADEAERDADEAKAGVVVTASHSGRNDVAT
jgi:hypothetical protein